MFDDDDDGDDDELLLQNGWLGKGVKPHLGPEPESQTRRR